MSTVIRTSGTDRDASITPSVVSDRVNAILFGGAMSHSRVIALRAVELCRELSPPLIPNHIGRPCGKGKTTKDWQK